MAEVRVRDRLIHILDNITNIRSLLDGRTMSDIEHDITARAALERFLEIISEASRHIPDALKQSYG